MKKLFLLGLSILSFSTFSNAQSSYWQNASVVNQVNYSAFGFEINTNALKAQLALAGNSPQTGVNLIVPSPEGKILNFNVWRNGLIPEGLQSKFPDVWSFTAMSTDRPGLSAKFEFSPRGLYGMIYDGASTIVIDPVDYGAPLEKSYYKMDAPKDPMNGNFTCGVEEESNGLGLDNIDRIRTASYTLGSVKRTYRLALSCTGEYAVAVAGANPTSASVFAAMTTSMNRVNGVYERELGVTMVFIANENLLIYTDPTLDPFTANNNGGSLLGQNQSNTNSVIGSANYDIGHIFSTGGGGIAQLACVCSNNNKAKGVTGSPNPVGDPYDVDYVCHEMGHQFGANHTFNKCSGTEYSPTAYEPGSGSTIMAYAGICGSTNDIQNNSDDYFHRISILEIGNRFDNGNTGNCAVTSTGYTAPSFSVPSTSYIIPKKTPFDLSFPSTTPLTPGNTVKTNIEQWNTGNFQQDENLSASFIYGPSFRSMAPDTFNYRSFPRNTILRSGLLETKGERLSDMGRDYQFAYTAREVQPDAWGAVNTFGTFTNITVDGTSGPFLITFPTYLDSIIKNTVNVITWDVANSNLSPVNCATVDIYLSLDGGVTFPTVLASNLPNTGVANVMIPDVSTTSARVKIKASNNIFFTYSRRDVVIGTTSSWIDTSNSINDLAVNAAINIYPNPASNVLNIELQHLAKRGSLKLVNAIGQEIWTGSISPQNNSLQINTRNFAKGLYILKFVDINGGFAAKRLILQ